jgi:hypothetical protein
LGEFIEFFATQARQIRGRLDSWQELHSAYGNY